LNYINCDDYILDFLQEELDINLTETIFPMVEDKRKLIIFFNILNVLNSYQLEKNNLLDQRLTSDQF